MKEQTLGPPQITIPFSNLLFTSVKGAVEGKGVRLGSALTEQWVRREESSDITGLLFLTPADILIFQGFQSEGLLSTVMTIKKRSTVHLEAASHQLNYKTNSSLNLGTETLLTVTHQCLFSPLTFCCECTVVRNLNVL